MPGVNKALDIGMVSPGRVLTAADTAKFYSTRWRGSSFGDRWRVPVDRPLFEMARRLDLASGPLDLRALRVPFAAVVRGLKAALRPEGPCPATLLPQACADVESTP